MKNKKSVGIATIKAINESSNNEIDRVLFMSLVKLEDGAYSIMNDGNFLKKLYARDDKEAKEKFHRFREERKGRTATETYLKPTGKNEAGEQILNGYICFWRGKRLEIYSDTSYHAQLQAAKQFGAKKAYEVSVVLAELQGKPYTQTAVESRTSGAVRTTPKAKYTDYVTAFWQKHDKKTTKNGPMKFEDWCKREGIDENGSATEAVKATETFAADAIKQLTKEEAMTLLDSGEEGSFVPRGLFWLVDEDKFVGIDNADGNAWTEEFDTKKYMMKWLQDGMISADDIRKQERKELKATGGVKTAEESIEHSLDYPGTLDDSFKLTKPVTEYTSDELVLMALTDWVDLEVNEEEDDLYNEPKPGDHYAVVDLATEDALLFALDGWDNEVFYVLTPEGLYRITDDIKNDLSTTIETFFINKPLVIVNKDFVDTLEDLPEWWDGIEVQHDENGKITMLTLGNTSQVDDADEAQQFMVEQGLDLTDDEIKQPWTAKQALNVATDDGDTTWIEHARDGANDTVGGYRRYMLDDNGHLVQVKNGNK